MRGTDNVWCYSPIADAERWDGSCASRDEAIVEGAKELGIAPGGKFFVSLGVKPDPAELMPPGHWAIEMAQEKACDEGGEVAEDWPDVTDEAEKELDELLKAWARKHAPVNFWVVGKAEEVTAPEANDAGA